MTLADRFSSFKEKFSPKHRKRAAGAAVVALVVIGVVFVATNFGGQARSTGVTEVLPLPSTTEAEDQEPVIAEAPPPFIEIPANLDVGPSVVVRQQSYIDEPWAGGPSNVKLYKLTTPVDDTLFILSSTGLGLKPGWEATEVGGDEIWNYVRLLRSTTQVINERYIAFSEKRSFTSSYEEKLGIYDTISQDFYYLYDNAINQEQIFLLTSDDPNSFTYYFSPANDPGRSTGDTTMIIKRVVSLPSLEAVDTQVFAAAAEFQPTSAEYFRGMLKFGTSTYLTFQRPDTSQLLNAFKLIGQSLADPISLSNLFTEYVAVSELAQDAQGYYIDPVTNRQPHEYSDREISIYKYDGSILQTIVVPRLHNLRIVGETSAYVYVGVKYNCPYGNGCYDGAYTQILAIEKSTGAVIEAITNNLVEDTSGSFMIFRPDVTVTPIGLVP